MTDKDAQPMRLIRPRECIFLPKLLHMSEKSSNFAAGNEYTYDGYT